MWWFCCCCFILIFSFAKSVKFGSMAIRETERTTHSFCVSVSVHEVLLNITLKLTWFNFQVLWFLLQLPVFTKQDDKACAKATVQDAMMKLKTDGGGPLGKFNKNYMAFTWTDVQNNFNNLISMVKHANLSALKPSSSSVYPVTNLTGDCTVNQGKFPYCSACAAVTDLGPDRFPRYINEIVCENPGIVCGPQADGFCKTSGIDQQFLIASCDSSTGKQTFDTFTQHIRSCCECFLFWLDISVGKNLTVSVTVKQRTLLTFHYIRER